MTQIRSTIDDKVDQLLKEFNDLLFHSEVNYVEPSTLTLTSAGKVAIRLMMMNAYYQGVKDERSNNLTIKDNLQ